MKRLAYFWKEQITLTKLTLQSDYFGIGGKLIILLTTILLIIPWVIIDFFDKDLKHN